MDVSRLLVLNTGGNLAMYKTNKGTYGPGELIIEKNLKENAKTNDEKFDRGTVGLNQTWLVLPKSNKRNTIAYNIIDHERLKDSSNISIDDWIKIIKTIGDNYHRYDGFIILHGTDTMAYTAAALSFATENLSKPIILTGSNLPIEMKESNWMENIISSLEIAGNKQFHHNRVTLFFDGELFQGNRVSNVSNTNSAFFKSPNCRHLLLHKNGEFTDNNLPRIVRRHPAPQFHLTFSQNVSMLLVYPGINSNMIKHVLQSVRGLVLLTYGTGNCPSSDEQIIDEIKSACKRGVLIVNCTQCNRGSVNNRPIYETGSWLIEAGVIPGADMTKEAAFAKLSYLVGREDIMLEQKKRLMAENMNGELTVPPVW